MGKKMQKGENHGKSLRIFENAEVYYWSMVEGNQLFKIVYEELLNLTK